MEPADDGALLRQYAENHSDEAGKVWIDIVHWPLKSSMKA
jgi:hypothetical protein